VTVYGYVIAGDVEVTLLAARQDDAA